MDANIVVKEAWQEVEHKHGYYFTPSSPPHFGHLPGWKVTKEYNSSAEEDTFYSLLLCG